MVSERLEKQVAFLVEIDKMKQVFRQTVLMDRSRQENDAEHSWHLAMLAMLLAEYAPEEVDVFRAVQMVLVHDLVEIDAGDTYCYDEAARATQAAREQAAADRIFNLLPEDQAAAIFSLWEEFEAKETAESRFANAVDRFQPLLHNFRTEGEGWRKHGVTREQVLDRNQPIEDGAPALWAYAKVEIEAAVRKGWLARSDHSSR